MAENTEISWTDSTFNPWWGCSNVSPGCDHCYARRLDRRMGGDHWGAGKMYRLLGDENWKKPLKTNSTAYRVSTTCDKSPARVRFLSVEPLLEDLGDINLNGIDWVIVGGESGPGARQMKDEWVFNIEDQCKKAGVAFFFKQWGGTRDKGGCLLRGFERKEWPLSSIKQFYLTFSLVLHTLIP